MEAFILPASFSLRTVLVQRSCPFIAHPLVNFQGLLSFIELSQLMMRQNSGFPRLLLVIG